MGERGGQGVAGMGDRGGHGVAGMGEEESKQSAWPRISYLFPPILHARRTCAGMGRGEIRVFSPFFSDACEPQEVDEESG